MAVSYAVIPKGNPGNPDAPEKFYVRAKLKKLSKKIAEGSTTVSDTDVLAALNEFILKRSPAFKNSLRVNFKSRRAFGGKGGERLKKANKGNKLYRYVSSIETGFFGRPPSK